MRSRLINPSFHMAKAAEAAELGVLVMFWTVSRTWGRGVVGTRRSGFWKDKEMQGKDGVGSLVYFRDGSKKHYWAPTDTRCFSLASLLT